MLGLDPCTGAGTEIRIPESELEVEPEIGEELLHFTQNVSHFNPPAAAGRGGSLPLKSPAANPDDVGTLKRCTLER
jgi:hypothetical protein